MFSRVSKALVLLAALQILGGHWMALQTAAWVGMVAEYARGSSLGVALEKTFDGAHPCTLCRAVKSGQAEEKRQEAVKTVVKVEAVLAAVLIVPAPTASAWEFPVCRGRMTARPSAPPTQPPLVG